MNHLVIDLEMCKVPRDYRSKRYKYANETIQICRRKDCVLYGRI